MKQSWIVSRAEEACEYRHGDLRTKKIDRQKHVNILSISVNQLREEFEGDDFESTTGSFQCGHSPSSGKPADNFGRHSRARISTLLWETCMRSSWPLGVDCKNSEYTYDIHKF